MLLQVDIAPKTKSKIELLPRALRESTPRAWPVVGSDDTTQDSEETQPHEKLYVPSLYVRLDLLHDITPSEYTNQIEDILGTSVLQPPPGYQ